MENQSKTNLNQQLLPEEEKQTKPQEEAKEEKKLPPAPFFSLFHFTTPSEKIKLIIGSLSALAAGAAFPFFLIFFADITTIFDERYRDQSAQKGWELCYKFFIVGGVTWIAHFLGTYFWNVVGSEQAVRIKKEYYKTLLDQEIAWYDENDPNKIVTKVTTNITHIEAATGEKMSLNITTIVTSLVSIFLAFFKCWQLSLIMLATLPALLIVGIFFFKSLMLSSQKEKISYEKASSRTEQALSQIRTVKGLVGEDFEVQKFTTSLQEGQKTTIKYSLMSAIGYGAIIFVFVSMYALGFWYGKNLIVDNIDSGEYNAAVILSCFFCFLVGGSSISQISPFMKNIAEGRVAMAEFFDLLNREKTLIQPRDGKKIKDIKKIELGNVNFHYKTDQPVLKNVCIKFGEGKVSALVGQSGCGKSTIVQLLMRYYDCIEGAVTINGQNIKNINMNNYRRKIGFVGQEPVLFAMSIADNLKLADPTLTESEMVEALKKANAWQFVEKMEKKLDTYVGSGGTQLSGGQKQRIAIARAICKKPQILILDEATSALDRRNEREIQKTLQNLQESRITTIVIAHRLSTIRNADCIYVMRKGELAEKGTHNYLVEQAGVYSELVKTQLAAEEQVQATQGLEIAATSQEEEKQEQQVVENKVEQAEIPEQKKGAVFRKLFGYQKSNCLLLIIGIIGSLGAGLVWPFFNFIFSGILQLMMRPVQNNDELNTYCFYIEIIAVVAAVMTFAYQFCFSLTSEKLVYRIRVDMFNKLMRLPVSFYDKPVNTAGGINSKLATDAYQIRNMVSGVLGVMCLNLATVGSSLAFGLYYSWKVTLISLALSPLIAVVGSINMKVIMKFTSKSQDTEKFLGSLMSDSVCNMRTVKSFGHPKTFMSDYSKKLDELNEVNSKKHFTSCFLTGMSKAMIMIVEGIVFYLAALLFQDNQVDSGRAVFTAVMSVIFAAMGVGQNSQFMPDMAKAKVAGAGIFDILESKDQNELSIQNGGNLIEEIDGTIEFRDVTFKYPEREKIVLENLSFRVDKGKIALVGHSGSGKSTVIQLLLRFYDPLSGEILLNNKNINQFDLYSLRRQYGLVSQQPALFLGNVEDNIRYNTTCTQEDIQKATKIAQASGFINDWEEGFNKEVGQKGGQVSGGQKQRIALSRCLVKKPKVFLFDQFTSALDADTEKDVFENLKEVLKNKTSLSIAHRLSTIEDADSIMVFKDGRIIEQGTFKELMELRSHFYSLAKGQ